jgi:hypothetical protein
MSRRKSDIENAGLSGMPVAFADVARVSRSKRVVTLRHVWAESCDGRIWSAVRLAVSRGAQDLADSTGRTVEVYSARGHMISAHEPRRT